MSVLVVVDHDRGELAPASLEALTAARRLGLAGHRARRSAPPPTRPPARSPPTAPATVHQAHHELLGDYGPETWGAVVAHAVDDDSLRPSCWHRVPTVATR